MNNPNQQALNELKRIKLNFKTLIRENFEHNAQNCQTCPTQGVCCTDAHFVNVHITRLEARAIDEVLLEFPAEKQLAIKTRIQKAIAEYNLKDEGDTFAQTFACPLFEPKIGCLIHENAKPAPCIQHACYDRREDLPPQCLQDFAEQRIGKIEHGNLRHGLEMAAVAACH